jgi:hypothetical protein
MRGVLVKSYSETTVFSPVALALREVVEHLVERLPDPEPGKPLWRCHEVARAVREVLTPSLEVGGSGAQLHVFDGKYGPPDLHDQVKYSPGVEHSWIVVIETASKRPGCVLDPYAVGRLPQVQLVDWEQQFACMYKPREYRTDIDKAVVQHMVDVWQVALSDLATKGNEAMLARALRSAPGIDGLMLWLRAEDMPDGST